MKYLFLTTLLFSGMAQSSDWPEIQFPDTAKVEIVADNMTHNGYPMKTWLMTDKQSQMMTASYFKNLWKNNSFRFDARMFNGDYIINSLQPPYLLTVRIQSNFDGVIAYVGITKDMDEQSLHQARKNSFPTLMNSDVISDIHSNDIYKNGRTLTIASKQSVSTNYYFYRNYFLQQGWVENIGLLEASIGTAALQLSKGTDVVDISFNKENDVTYIVANQVMERQ